ncbi:unnamed protein product [Rotaria sp. Silwood1]|nr:unnamed protein product [Rotaria sp. Silwood1]CAF0785359.1 unnamed protein product [Rotaria sp. Silwood1]CAF3346973.1 unnamed protein product [Rotaria sp. Silwood1]
MKSQMFTLLLLVISTFFFQSTHQYRLSKRELTEYDLTSFIVNTCSADKTDMFIQNLCDQTLQSALMGNFPILTYYCKTIGVKMSYCNNFNGPIDSDQNAEPKRFVSRRFARSLNKDNKLYHKGQEIDNDVDLEEKLIMQLCMTTTTEKSSVDTEKFCNRTLYEVLQGRYPAIKRLCKYHPSFDYCHRIRSYSLLLSWPLSKASSILSSSSSNSITPDVKHMFVPSSASKSSDIESFIHQQRINKENNYHQQINI